VYLTEYLIAHQNGKRKCQYKVKVRNIKTGTLLIRATSMEQSAKCASFEKDMQYLYKDEEAIIHGPQSYEQSYPLSLVPDHIYLKEGDTLMSVFLKESHFHSFSTKNDLRVVETAPGQR